MPGVYDEAGATCRNAAIELEELAGRVRAKCMPPERDQYDQVPKLRVELALLRIETAAAELHRAANDFYREEERP